MDIEKGRLTCCAHKSGYTSAFFLKEPFVLFKPFQYLSSFHIYHGSNGNAWGTCIVYSYIDIRFVVFSSEVRQHNTTYFEQVFFVVSFIYLLELELE